MFKRANKITALLVAAASMISLVPAMAADSTRLGTKDGTIEDAIAYKDGKYAFEGYKTDDNNKSVYFNDGSKDKEINDLTDATINDASKYDTSSTIAWDGNDEYLLDLSNGKVTDEDVASDLASTAKDKLIAKLKKTDRYGDYVTTDKFERITPDQFGDVWYEYSASKDGVNSAVTGIKGVVDYEISNAQATAIIAAPATPFKIDGETVSLTSTSATSGYTSGNKASFKAYLEAAQPVANYTTTVDATTGEITLTQTAVANNDYATTGVGAYVSANALQTAATTAVNAFKVGSTTVQPTLSQAATDTLGSTQGKPTIIKFQPTSFASNITINGVTVLVKTDGTSAVSTVTGLKEAINAHSFTNYDVAATVTSTNGISVKLTKKTATAVFTQANITAGDYTNGNNGSVAGSVVNPVVIKIGSTGTGTSSSDSTYTGYTNKTGAYIDADKTANLRVYNGSKMVKLDEFDEDANADGVKATVTETKTIAQDKDFIYRVIKVDFTGSTATLKNSKGSATITDHKYLQKISKAQGETEKDAYLPKTVESYELDGTISGDADTAASKIATLLSNDSKVVGARVVDGTLYYTEMDDADTIKTYVLKLQKNEKVEATGSSTKVDAYVVKKDGDKDHDLKGDAGKDGASFDINGNLWIINEGKIYKSEKAGDFKEMFTCDRSIDSLDVYDSGSLIAWDGNGNVYTTQQEGTKVTEGESTAVAPVIVTGWVQGTDGTWTFNDVTGAKVTNKWITVGGTWYMMKADGIMATGWYLDNGTWYFLKPSGAMVTGWYNDNGTWYYLNASGAMLANTTVDGYVLNGSGAWVK